MAAPAPTTPIIPPSGQALKDGYRTVIGFASDPSIALWEKTVTPPGADGGDAVDNTTMWNDQYRTKSARALMDITDSSFTAAYDPEIFDDTGTSGNIYDLINEETTITVLFPNGDTLAYFGYLKMCEPEENAEGEQPTCTCTIVATNQDASGTEQAPVWTASV